MHFRIPGRISNVQTIAAGRAIRELRRLRRVYGAGLWRKRKGIARVELETGAIRTVELHWYEAQPSARMSTRSNGTSTRSARHRPRKRPSARSGRLVLCLRNDGYEVSLEPRKTYAALPDRDAAAHDQLRVIDESGDDYLFPAALFAPIRLPAALRRAVLGAV